jgi:hypothetical protein
MNLVLDHNVVVIQAQLSASSGDNADDNKAVGAFDYWTFLVFIELLT